MKLVFPKIDDMVTFQHVGNDPTCLPYDPANPAADGAILIGDVMSDDCHSANRWSIVPLHDKYAIQIETLFEDFDEDGEPIESDHAKAYMLPYEEGGTVQSFVPDAPPVGFFDTVEDAYAAFLEIVYSSENTEAHFEICQDAKTLLDGYIDPAGCSFTEFKEKFWNATAWDAYAHKLGLTKVSNAMLCVRYPFLVPWHSFIKDDQLIHWGDEGEFSRTVFDNIPAGWAYRFGLEICEDLRNQAYDENANIWTWRMCNMRIDQIKEKFGGLRWYGTEYGKGSKLIDAYEQISYSVCINCGKAANTRVTGGWVSPYCAEELIADEKVDSDEQIRFAFDRDDWDAKYAARELERYCRVIEKTRAAATADDYEEMMTEWNWTVFGSNGQETVNEAIGLLDGTPAPNGEPVWAVQVIKEIATEIRAREDAGFPEKMCGYMEMLGVGAEEIPAWYKDEEETN